MPGEKPEALVMAEGAAKLAFGTRFKKLPSAIFAKLSLPVVMVLGIIFFVYYTVVFGVVIPWMENSVPGVLNVGVLTITAGLGLVMYLCCVYCEPGRVPADWRPDTEAGGALLELKRKGKDECTGLSLGSNVWFFSQRLKNVGSDRSRCSHSNGVLSGAFDSILRRRAVLQEVYEVQAPPHPPLPGVQQVRASHGPPLRVGQQLHRPSQL